MYVSCHMSVLLKFESEKPDLRYQPCNSCWDSAVPASTSTQVRPTQNTYLSILYITVTLLLLRLEVMHGLCTGADLHSSIPQKIKF